VVLDLTARRAWVATAPHTLGDYVPIDLEAVLADRGGREPVSGERPIPADPFLVSGDWDRYRAARRELLAARALSAKGEWSAARERLARAHALSPGFLEATGRLAEACAHADERERALALLDEALAHDPGPAPLRSGLEALRDAITGGGPLPSPALPAILEPDEMMTGGGR
jgi:tetratricopeptide (TPR) repeat protein